MPKVNEPQRFISRGKTRTIGEPRRPLEATGTVKERAALSSAERRVGQPRAGGPETSEQGTGRVHVGEPKAYDSRTDPTRPMARIEALEKAIEGLHADVNALSDRTESLFVLLEGAGIVDNELGVRERGVVPTIELLEEAIALLAESVGDLRKGGDTMPPSEPDAAEQKAHAEALERLSQDSAATASKGDG